MANFTEEIKNEIMAHPVATREEALAFISAFIRTGGGVIKKDSGFGFAIVTENERTAQFIVDLTESFFSVGLNVVKASLDLKNGKDKLTIECSGVEAEKLLRETGDLRGEGEESEASGEIDGTLIADERCASAYLCGAFLGGGSCTLPDEQTYSKTGYHFEVVFYDRVTAYGFLDVLSDMLILAKMVMRKESAVVYAKSKEVISDVLGVMGVTRCLNKFSKLVEKRDISNNENRVGNCSASNIDKTVTASVAQIKAIEIISQTIGLQSLDKMLFEVAEARLADPHASMQELAERLGISKSCINHRMRKIAAIALQLS